MREGLTEYLSLALPSGGKVERKGLGMSLVEREREERESLGA